MSAEFVETIHDCTDWCGLYVRSIVLAERGDRAEQHEHAYDHLTYCGSGAAEYWEDGVHIGNVKAGGAVRVFAGRRHHFVALEHNTRLACLHDTRSAVEQRSL